MTHFRFRDVAGWVTIATGPLVWSLLPEHWIEQRFGWNPDGGSGLLEVLITAIPMAVGAALVIGRGSSVPKRAA